MSTQWHGDAFMRKLEKAAQSISSVSLSDLMPPDFVQQHTKFGSLDEMFVAGKLVGENKTDREVTVALQSEAWDKFVVENSGFSSWDEMIATARNERLKNSLDEQ